MLMIIVAKRVKTKRVRGSGKQGGVTSSIFVMRVGFIEKVTLNRDVNEV